MSARRTITSTLLLLVCLLITSAATAQEQLRWKFSEGQKFAHEMTQETKMTMNAGGQMVNTTMSQILDGSWTVDSVDAQGDAQITQEINRVRMQMQGPMGFGFDIDTDQEQQAQGIGATIAPALEAMAQAKFIIKVNPQGEVLDVQVPEEVLAAFQRLPGADQMGGMFSKEGFASMIKQGTPSFPAEPIQKGATWAKQYEMKVPPLGTMVVKNDFTYAGQEKVDNQRLSKIDVKMDMQLQPGEGAAGPFGNIAIKDQKSDGVIYFNNVAGYMTRSRINQDMTMEFGAGNQTFSQKINQTISATLQPVDTP